jgi:hypothetical protein
MVALGRTGGVASGEARRELGKSVRELLREKAEADADLVWGALRDGLTAEFPDGKPDARTRVMAATALMAEAYGRPAQAVEVSGRQGAPVQLEARQLLIGAVLKKAIETDALDHIGLPPQLLGALRQDETIEGEATDVD